MTASGDNRFQDFFADEKYVALKNLLYNYQLRKRAVEKAMQDEEKGVVLEIGSGISPVLSSWNRIVYSDLSFPALSTLRRLRGKGHYVVADGMNLPFKRDAFSHVISSEVLEHLTDDRKALREIVRVIKPGGGFVVTFPHRRFYFANDDRFVNHHRRYELPEMASRLQEAGLDPHFVCKVLGPLEKITMIIITGCIAILQGAKGIKGTHLRQSKPAGAMIKLFKWTNKVYAVFARIDAWIMPRALSAVLLIKAEKGNDRD
jgi:ubiquinone/menaquinone biosynthesis C-methylase UbiE